jgi:hypothetical protein
MNKHAISIHNLKLSVNKSLVDASIVLGFSSLQSLQDSIQNVKLNIQLRNAQITNADILYFVPDLKKLAFFKHLQNITTAKGNLSGTIQHLVGNKVIVTTGINTIITTDFSIIGLPNTNKTVFDFPNLNITTGRTDIVMIVDTLLPKTINLPEKAQLFIVYKGSLHSFHSKLNLLSSIGSAHAIVAVDSRGDFNLSAHLLDLNLGYLLKNKAMFGPLTLDAEMQGQGLYGKTMTATLKAQVPSIYCNAYTYQNLNLQGFIRDRSFDGTINLADENAAFDFEGLINLNPKEEAFMFNLNVAGVNLKKLLVTNDDFRIAFNAHSAVSGMALNDLNGNATISNIALSHIGKAYILDSICFLSINKPGTSELTLHSSLIDAQYSGLTDPSNLVEGFGRYLNHYFPFSEDRAEKNAALSDFSFDIQLHNHPIISEVFFPELKAFEDCSIEGGFSEKNQKLDIKASIQNIVYGSIVLKDLMLAINSDKKAIHYNLACQSLSNETIKADNVLLAGKIEDGKISTTISSIDSDKNKKLVLHSELTKDNANYKLTLDSSDFYLMNKRWDIAADNYLLLGKQGFLIHNLSFSKAASMLSISSVHNRFNDDLQLEIKQFKLFDLAGIIAKDSSMLSGILDGKFLLSKDSNAYSITADATIDSLLVKKVPIGRVILKIKNQSPEKLNADLSVLGDKNNVTVKGFLLTQGNEKSLHFTTDIQSLSMKTIQAFSMDQIADASGTIAGNISLDGTISKPLITGLISVDSVFLTD